MIDASELGRKIKDGKNQKPYFPRRRTKEICNTFTHKQRWKISAWWSATNEIKAKNYSLSAGSMFEVKIDYVDISADEFEQKMAGFSADLTSSFAESAELKKRL
ncbi:MAG: hypothetical protein ACLR5N_07705 [Haemophilus parainfluenzae]